MELTPDGVLNLLREVVARLQEHSEEVHVHDDETGGYPDRHATGNLVSWTAQTHIGQHLQEIRRAASLYNLPIDFGRLRDATTSSLEGQSESVSAMIEILNQEIETLVWFLEAGPPAALVVRTFSQWQELLAWSPSTWGRRRKEFPDCFTDVPGENACSIREPELSLWLKSAESRKQSPFEKT